jgi:hypothetical protein
MYKIPMANKISNSKHPACRQAGKSQISSKSQSPNYRNLPVSVIGHLGIGIYLEFEF